METDHIIQKADGGKDEIENAIPVCFECHAEIRAYNPKHPKGRKFTSEEIRQHKTQWLEICKTKPEILMSPIDYQVGPINALVDELDFNDRLATEQFGDFFCLYRDEQFRVAVRSGSISILDDSVRKKIYKAYILMGRVNQAINRVTTLNPNEAGTLPDAARDLISKAEMPISDAKMSLVSFLQTED
ncbi:MAG: HNH endonuclease [Acidobacteria bacterium]|nr:HNH endonuclease [Acidobacteriota bacterium]